MASRVPLSPRQLVEHFNHRDFSLPMAGEKMNQVDGEEASIRERLGDLYNALNAPTLSASNQMIQAEWDGVRSVGIVKKETGKHLRFMGTKELSQTLLFPEETLFLLESGKLSLKFSRVDMSVQSAYQILLKNSGCSLAEYRVYSHLKKLGFDVLRHDKSLKSSKIPLICLSSDDEVIEIVELDIDPVFDDESVSSTYDRVVLDQGRGLKVTLNNLTTPKMGIKRKLSERVGARREIKKKKRDLRSKLNQRARLSFNCSIPTSVVTLSVPPRHLLPKNSVPKGSVYTFRISKSCHSSCVASVDAVIKPQRIPASHNPRDWMISKSGRNFSGNFNAPKRKQNKKGKKRKIAPILRRNPFAVVTKNKVPSSDDSDPLRNGPLACLWKGKTKPLLEPKEARFTDEIMRKIEINPMLKQDTREINHSLAKFDLFVRRNEHGSISVDQPDFLIVVVSETKEFIFDPRSYVSETPIIIAQSDLGAITFLNISQVNLPRDVTMG